MSDPFNDRHNVDRPQSAVTHESPRRYLPNAPQPSPFNNYRQPGFQQHTLNPQSTAAARYSPSVAFRTRNLTQDDDFQTPHASPTRAHHTQYETNVPELTPRAQWAELESPKRKTQETVIVIEDDEEDDRQYYRNSEYRVDIQRSPTRGSNSTYSSSGLLSPPKPIFSASTYAAANLNHGSHQRSGGFDPLPTIQPNSRISSGGSSSTVDYEAEDAFNEKLEAQQTALSGSTIEDYEHHRHYVKQGYLDSEDEMEDYSVLPQVPTQAQPRRNRSMIRKQVKAVHGNLILEEPIPTKLLDRLPLKDEEFSKMRYSACTSDPDNFVDNHFTLKTSLRNRHTEICVCITMYNESEVDFTRTMHAVMKNIAYLCSRERSTMWGPEGWKKVQVIIVSDGRQKIDKHVLDVLCAMGVYQAGLAKSTVNGEDVNAHLFEYTTQVSLDTDLEYKSSEIGLVPVQILFCLKEQNQKKINSHRWFFNAFCKVLNPNVVVLLDVGTKPNVSALYHLWKAFDRDSRVAGAAGEIKTLKGKYWSKLLNPLVASQDFEYKTSNILDKPLESAFGYISVLPGALSAYRYRALKNHSDGTGPLNSYFKGEKIHQNANRDVFSANMYLAEDRILCWELVAKKGDQWLLEYVREAKGETDLPETVSEFISQRRRWLNGALFAAIYSQVHFKQIWQTDHSLTRKFFFHIEFIYQFVQLLFSWFSIGNFYLTFYFLVGSLSGNEIIPHNGGFWLFTVLNYIFICVLCALFIISMGNRPQGAIHLFITCMVLLSICSIFALVFGLVFVFKTIDGTGSTNSLLNIVVSLLSTYGLYAFMSIIYLDPWHILTSSIQYFLLLPSYTCTLQIFAFCNTHDVSWGTKGDNVPTENLGAVYTAEGSDKFEAVSIPNIDDQYDECFFNIGLQRVANQKPQKAPSQAIPDDDYYRDVRSRVLLVWLITNLILIMTMVHVYAIEDTENNKYLAFILWSVAAFSLFRAIGSLYYLFHKLARWSFESVRKYQYSSGASSSSFRNKYSFKRLFNSDSE